MSTARGEDEKRFTEVMGCAGRIMLGVAALIFVMVVMQGFRQELLSKVLGLNGHLVMTPQEPPFTDFAQIGERISHIPGVRLAAPIVEGQVLATSPFNSSSVLARMPASDSRATYTGGRRPKVAKERTRGGWDPEGAAHSAMENLADAEDMTTNAIDLKLARRQPTRSRSVCL